MKNYEKPKMTFIKIASKRAVSNACWANIANGSAGGYYWDTNGTADGYYEFSFDAMNCGEGHFAENLNMRWWEARGDEDPALDPEGKYDHQSGPRLAPTDPDFIALRDYGKHHFQEGIEDLVPQDS